MNQTVFSRSGLTSFGVALFPIGLWMVMWLSISPGIFINITNPGNAGDFVHGIRTLFPFAAILVASAVILTKLRQRRPPGFGLVSPMGLVILYGLVGLIAISQSADGPVALRWALLYLSVPLVLAAIAWGTDPLVPLLRVINFTWLLIILGSTALFTVAILWMDLFEALITNSVWLECRHGSWYDVTRGQLRDTGVGRYAAISSIVALSGLWQRDWRTVWIFILLISVVLLVYSGSRGAYGGFFAGAALVVMANGGKKAVGVAAVAFLLLAPLVWSTGAHNTILRNCIFRGIDYSTPPTRPVAPPSRPGSSYAEILNQAQPDLETVQGSQPAIEATLPETTSVVAAPNPKATAQVAAAGPTPQQAPAAAESSAQPKVPPQTQAPSKKPILGVIPRGFFSFTGRAAVWVEGWELVKRSPLIGYGFHADRIMLNKHMHNSLMQALIQTGIVGTVAFVAAMLYGWALLLSLLRNLGRLPHPHKHVVIQAGAVLAFLSMRSLPESTGAFFGVDWLILAPILFYLHVMQRSLATSKSSA